MTASRRACCRSRVAWVRFRHELARRAIEASVAPTRRRALHQKVVDVLKRRPDARASEIAHHAERAGDSAALLKFAQLAGEEAAQGRRTARSRVAFRSHAAASRPNGARPGGRNLGAPRRASLPHRLIGPGHDFHDRGGRTAAPSERHSQAGTRSHPVDAFCLDVRTPRRGRTLSSTRPSPCCKPRRRVPSWRGPIRINPSSTCWLRAWTARSAGASVPLSWRNSSANKKSLFMPSAISARPKPTRAA